MKITQQGDGFTIRGDGWVIALDGLGQLLQLRTILNSYIDALTHQRLTALDDGQKTMRIDTAKAYVIAAQHGYTLPKNTLSYALTHHKIDAEKVGGQWRMSESSFREWLAVWMKKQRDQK